MRGLTLPQDISAYVSRHFAPSEQISVLKLLGSALQPVGEPADAHMLRCALAISGGKLANLQFDIDWMASDCRDVIVNAEFGRRDGAWVQLRDLSQPFSPSD
ncbi:MAG: hypothetical protein IPH50_05590 [Rhodanobacteraceae bacterium]|nr:hypothetical protein [Rhodanobacteraceae bacterium]